MNEPGFDQLANFADWYLKARPLMVPALDALSFYETAMGIVLYRQPPFQVQLFIALPGKPIAEHVHPNVDSFEVWLHGMEFSHNGNLLVSLAQAKELGSNGIPIPFGQAIRVRPSDTHGGVGGDKGGAFLSIQHWLNGVQPTCVARDWRGEAMGPQHASLITTGRTVH